MPRLDASRPVVTVAVALSVVAPGASEALVAQTVQGDILRGEGAYLRGRGIYDFYSAKGRQIDARTAIMVDAWNRQVYAAYMRARAAHMNYRKDRTTATEQQARRRMLEKEERLRTSPTDEDVVNGDALNALLVDLSDPAIGSSAWRNAVVALPPGLSIRTLFFRFAPRANDPAAGPLGNNLIALGRLDPSKGWPLFLPEDKVGAERRAYEAAYRRLFERCEKGELTLDDLTRIDRALSALKAKVFEAVPTERNFRTAAVRHVSDMIAATKIFDATTVDFAQEMIRDTHDFQPQNVGELLAFMRKYRLYFASAAGRPEDGDIHRTLFELLRRQKQALGVVAVPDAVERDKLQGAWVLASRARDPDVVAKKKAAANKAAAKKADGRRLTQSIEGDHFIVRLGADVIREGTWTVDPSRSPRWIDLKVVRGPEKGQTLAGIYELDGDTLRICWGPRRPDHFAAPQGSGRTLQVWARP